MIDSLGREAIASTKAAPRAVHIDSLGYSPSGDKFSASLAFRDPANVDNYYRVIIGKGIDNYEASNTDMVFSDNAFKGKAFGMSSKAGYERGDTITVRLYTLLKNHYDYLESVVNARAATYNPFVQPVKPMSNVQGGQGIFTAISYDEKTIVIK